ncbi:hypothetical protein [Caldicoprobacter faecalis]|uniref:Uncharacterized protein n=1 Tax=Caldicoprobacter faecalis TaxID=937334 RepID=A0A1I5VKL1_9FIRM|nr:hypothetical protein [Caldicoprobacter faecalis]SFQ07847.1 hypothetical protein SAMN05444406_11162 [Caldicoprobacter faecalis]
MVWAESGVAKASFSLRYVGGGGVREWALNVHVNVTDVQGTRRFNCQHLQMHQIWVDDNVLDMR